MRTHTLTGRASTGPRYSCLVLADFHEAHCRRLRRRCRGAVKPEKVLADDEGTFVKNVCNDDKWLVIELTLRIRVSALELLMLELYSSRVRDFDAYGSGTKVATASNATRPWAAAGWELLGRFRAANSKGAQVRMPLAWRPHCSGFSCSKGLSRISFERRVCAHAISVLAQELDTGSAVQMFDVSTDVWSRFLLIHFKSHHGSEMTCTVNTLRVFGTTEAEDLEAQLSALGTDAAASDGGSPGTTAASETGSSRATTGAGRSEEESKRPHRHGDTAPPARAASRSDIDSAGGLAGDGEPLAAVRLLHLHLTHAACFAAALCHAMSQTPGAAQGGGGHGSRRKPRV